MFAWNGVLDSTSISRPSSLGGSAVRRHRPRCVHAAAVHPDAAEERDAARRKPQQPAHRPVVSRVDGLFQRGDIGESADRDAILERLARSGRDRGARIPRRCARHRHGHRAQASGGPLPCSRNQTIRGHRRQGASTAAGEDGAPLDLAPGVADPLDSRFPRGAGLVADPADACEVRKDVRQPVALESVDRRRRDRRCFGAHCATLPAASRRGSS